GSAVDKAGLGFEPFTQVAGEFVSFGDVAVGGTGGQDDLDDGLVLVIFTDADNQFAVMRIFSFEHHPPAPLLRIVFDSVRKSGGGIVPIQLLAGLLCHLNVVFQVG